MEEEITGIEVMLGEIEREREGNREIKAAMIKRGLRGRGSKLT